MARSTRVISISVPEKLADELERMAAEEGISKSELVRLMAHSYRRERAGLALFEIQRELGPNLRAGGIVAEEDADRLAFEDR